MPLGSGVSGPAGPAISASNRTSGQFGAVTLETDPPDGQPATGRALLRRYGRLIAFPQCPATEPRLNFGEAMRIRILITCAGVVLVAVSATACSSGSTTTAAAPPAATTATSTSSPSGSSPSNSTATAVPAKGKLDGVPKTCPSADEVMSNLQLSKLVLDGGDPSMCRYLFNGSKSAPYVVITFNSAPGITPASFEAGLKSGQSDVEAVPGLADAAFTFTGSAGGSGLSFLSGDTISSIFSTVPTTTAGKIALAKSILEG